MKALVLNAGSSSLKCWYADVASSTEKPTSVWEHHADFSDGISRGAAYDALGAVPGPADVVGHRIVHGGSLHESVVITPEVVAQIEQESLIAPQHNRAALAGIDAVMRTYPQAIQIAVFDTAFHATLPPEAYVYPGPRAWLSQGIRRYGFHGISHGYATRRAAEMLRRPVESLQLITCHLGNGASLAAVQNGRSVDTTMGFTPLEGLMMGSRSGSIDPGILIHLMRHDGLTVDQLDHVLNHQSGLKGLSGISSDMREVLAALERTGEEADADAHLAFDVYIHRLAREIGAMRAALDGSELDALVFTGGIGEHSALVRSRACARCAFLGVQLDEAANRTEASNDRDIAAADSLVRVLVIHAEEEWEIARQCCTLLGN